MFLYVEHSCLWNRKAENHNNRQLRQRLLEVLCTQLSDHSVSFSGGHQPAPNMTLPTVAQIYHTSRIYMGFVLFSNAQFIRKKVHKESTKYQH